MARFFSLLFVLLLFLQRPTALGQIYAAQGLLAIMFLTACYVVYLAWTGRTIRAFVSGGQDLFALCAIVAAYLLYEFVIALVFGLTNLGFFAKEAFTTAIVIVCYGIFLLDRDNNERFFRQLTTVVSILGWSSAITLVALFFFGLDALQLFAFELKGYEGAEDVQAGTIYLPLSMAYMSIGVFEVPLLRFTGFFREPGIYQAVAAYCFVLASVAGRSKLVKLGLAAGIICTFSTIGMAMLVAAIGISYYLTHRLTYARLAATGAILILSVVALVYAPIVGLQDKAETAEVSINDRTQAAFNGIYRLAENPFGNGPFSSREANQDINLIAAAGSIGLLGFLLQTILLSGFRGTFNLARIGACMPLLITALTSQPIATAAVMYVLLMVWPHQRLPKAARTQALR